jgi:hypothetical protein
MPVCTGGAETKVRVSVGAWDDPNVVEVNYTNETTNWEGVAIDVSALTGIQYINVAIMTGDPS